MSAGTSFKTETVSQGKNFMPESQHQSPFLYLKNKQQNLGGRLTFGIALRYKDRSSVMM